MNTYQICFLLLAAAYVTIFLYEKVTGKAIFIKVKEALPIMQALRLLSSAVDGVYPSTYFDLANSVMDAAINATKKAEDLWKSGDINKEDRPEYCRFVLMDTLREAGIETTQQVEEIAQGAIALTCLLMPHGVNPDAEEETSE